MRPETGQRPSFTKRYSFLTQFDRRLKDNGPYWPGQSRQYPNRSSTMTELCALSTSRRRLLFAAIGLALVGLLAACGGPRPRPDQPNQLYQTDSAELKRFADRGYLPAQRYELEEHADAWFNGKDEIAISLLLPSVPGRYPVVLYLPGMGESADAGALWRKAWAEAGYAVLAVQPASVGQALRASVRARSGDFKTLAREQFSAGGLSNRIAVAQFALNELVRREASGQGPYKRIDPSRIAIVGYDIGAQTAQFFSGERERGVEAVPAMPALRSVILLSPYANLAAGGFESRYSAIHIPVLSVTGTEDTDDYGLVTSPMTRQAPFRYMASDSKYLLSLNDGTHRLLAGRAFTEGEQALQRQEGGDRQAGSDMGSRRGSGRRGSGGEPGGSGGGRHGSSGGTNTGERSPGALRAASPAADAPRQTIAVQSMSTAFLDATLKDDAVAREWLVRDAARWLQPLATLTTK